MSYPVSLPFPNSQPQAKLPFRSATHTTARQSRHGLQATAHSAFTRQASARRPCKSRGATLKPSILPHTRRHQMTMCTSLVDRKPATSTLPGMLGRTSSLFQILRWLLSCQISKPRVAVAAACTDTAYMHVFISRHTLMLTSKDLHMSVLPDKQSQLLESLAKC